MWIVFMPKKFLHKLPNFFQWKKKWLLFIFNFKKIVILIWQEAWSDDIVRHVMLRINHCLPIIFFVLGSNTFCLQWNKPAPCVRTLLEDNYQMEKFNNMFKIATCWKRTQTCLFNFSVFLSWVFYFHTWFPCEAMQQMPQTLAGGQGRRVQRTAPVGPWTTPNTGVFLTRLLCVLESNSSITFSLKTFL